MSAYRQVDAKKLLSGERDFVVGERVSPPDPGVKLGALVSDVRIGKLVVRFVLFAPPDDGPPFYRAVWTPRPPKRFSPTVIRKFRAERRSFLLWAAQEFNRSISIVDRFVAPEPRIVEIVHADGTSEILDPPVVLHEPVLH